MSFIYKTILRSENKDFDLIKNRHNSRLCHVIPIDRKTRNAEDTICIIDNKTGNISFINSNRFKSKTIDKLISAIANYFK